MKNFPKSSRRFLALETLETRQHMSASLALSAAQMENVNPKLLAAVTETLAGKQNSLVTNRSVRFDNGGAVQMYVRSSKVDQTSQQLQNLGIKVDAANAEMGVVQAWIAPALMDDALALPAVQKLDLPDYAMHNVTSAGDAVHLADQVRSKFNFGGNNFNGAGIKIGVISDGATNRANVGAELPSVTVNPALPGNGNEGTAMLEIVHDLAPGAQLYFSGPQSSVDMVNSINYLKNQGCDVIVDDITFLAEHYFSDTAVANAAKQAVTDGVVYVTSAGNVGTNQHYQGQYFQSQSAFGGGRLHRFGAAGEDANHITIQNGSRFRGFLQWSDAATTSSNDYDLYLFNSNTFTQLDSGTTIQNGNDIPFEFVDWTNNTGATVQAELWVVKKDGAASRELELLTFGNSFMEFQTQSDCPVSQAAVPEVMSVAAVPASSPNNIEPFSSRGGSTIYTNFSTQTKTVRQSLDGAATDGVQTKIGQLGFFNNPFFGTSASAPHAAAIAALVRGVNPNLTPAQVLQTMADTATDLGVAGYDTTFGAGRYNALNAVYKAYTPAAPDLHQTSDTGVSNSDNLTADSTPLFQGTVPADSFVELLVDGVVKSSQQLGSGNTLFQITSTALADGAHTATIRVAANSSVPVANRSIQSQNIAFTIDTTKPLITDKQFVYDAPAQKITYTFGEAMFAGSLNGLAITNLTNNTMVSITDVAIAYDAPSKTATYSFPNFATGLNDGNYTATLTGAVDLAFNVALPGTFDFFVLAGDANHDRTVNISDFAVLAGNFNTAGTFSDGDFNYSGQVDIGDFSILASGFNNSLADGARMKPADNLVTPSAMGGRERSARFSELTIETHLQSILGAAGVE